MASGVEVRFIDEGDFVDKGNGFNLKDCPDWELQYSSQIVETGAICLEFFPNFFHSLFTPLFSLKCAPSPSPMLS